MTRLFKPGDRVILKSGGPIMEVIKYVESPMMVDEYTVQELKSSMRLVRQKRR